jgi:hypothetical protein
VLSLAGVLRDLVRRAAMALDIRENAGLPRTKTLLAVAAVHGDEAFGQGWSFQTGDERDKRDQSPELGSEPRGRSLRSLPSPRSRPR